MFVIKCFLTILLEFQTWGLSSINKFPPTWIEQLWGIYSTKLFHQFKFKPRTSLGTLGQNKGYVYFGTRGRVRFLYTGERFFLRPLAGKQKFYFLALVWCLGRLSPSDVLSIKNSGLNHYNVVKPENASNRQIVSHFNSWNDKTYW